MADHAKESILSNILSVMINFIADKGFLLVA